jgi:acid phosphatase type 7
MDDRRALARTAGLLAVVFVATLILLAGLVLGLAARAPATHPPASGVAGGPTGAAVSPTPTASGGASETAPSGSIPPASGSVAPSSSGDPVLVGAGDIASCALAGDEATAKLLDGIAGTVFTAGDNAYEDGSAEQFRDCYNPTWGRHKERTRPAAGNHDYVTKDAAAYRAYFGAAATNADGKTWYSYDLGAWHIVVLDSDCGSVGCGQESDQGRWLAADLAASGTRCTLAIWHHPRFSSGEHGDDREVAPFWDQLYAAGADVVINGHDHDYERFAPQDPSGHEDRGRGIREFVVGTGGAVLRDFSKNIATTSELRIARIYGVMKLTLHPTGYNWTWIPTDGAVTDSGSATCH